MPYLNQGQYTGVVGKDAVTRELGDGKKVVSFPIAIKRYGKQEQNDDWMSVSVFGREADDIDGRISAGDTVSLQGQAYIYEWKIGGQESKHGLKVDVGFGGWVRKIAPVDANSDLSLNQIQLLGHAGKDAVQRHSQNGGAVLGFSLAVDRGFKDKKTTDWFDIVVVGKPAEFLAGEINKGGLVLLQGIVSHETWKGNDSTRHSAKVFVGFGGFIHNMSRKSAGNSGGYASQGSYGGGEQSEPAKGGVVAGAPEPFDDIPF